MKLDDENLAHGHFWTQSVYLSKHIVEVETNKYNISLHQTSSSVSILYDRMCNDICLRMSLYKVWISMVVVITKVFGDW